MKRNIEDIGYLLDMKHLIIDCYKTWPKELLVILKDDKNIFENYLDEESNIDNKAIEHVYYRIHRPDNEFQKDWDEALIRVREILSKTSFIGFHCSRLTVSESEEIQEYGLKPLSYNLLKCKLNRLIKMGLINNHDYLLNLSNTQLNVEGRKDRVFTFHALSTLKDESGLYRLFRCWGGEFFYYSKEDMSCFRNVFFNIGKPTIIITSHSYEDVQDHKIEIRIIKNFLDRFGSQNNDFDNNSNRTLKVLGYINSESKLFYELTGYDKWRIDLND